AQVATGDVEVGRRGERPEVAPGDRDGGRVRADGTDLSQRAAGGIHEFGAGHHAGRVDEPAVVAVPLRLCDDDRGDAGPGDHAAGVEVDDVDRRLARAVAVRDAGVQDVR